MTHRTLTIQWRLWLPGCTTCPVRTCHPLSHPWWQSQRLPSITSLPTMLNTAPEREIFTLGTSARIWQTQTAQSRITYAMPVTHLTSPPKKLAKKLLKSFRILQRRQHRQLKHPRRSLHSSNDGKTWSHHQATNDWEHLSSY